MNLIKTLKPCVIFKKTFFVLISLLALSSNVFSKIELIDRVVADVASGVIIESQLSSRVEEILIRLKSDKA